MFTNLADNVFECVYIWHVGLAVHGTSLCRQLDIVVGSAVGCPAALAQWQQQRQQPAVALGLPGNTGRHTGPGAPAGAAILHAGRAGCRAAHRSPVTAESASAGGLVLPAERRDLVPVRIQAFQVAGRIRRTVHVVMM